MTALSIVYALLGISLLIFVHELGHFLAAKRVGVRVERFAIGFDPPIRGRNFRLISFRRGGTEYVLGGVPFGGYVKLAGGEMLLDPSHVPAPDELPGKSVSARALVFAAGSFMNVLLAFVCFMLAFTLGVPFPEATLGLVVPGTPAWEAGLRVGDRIVNVDGEAVIDFTELRLAAALGSSQKPILLEVERQVNGEEKRITFAVQPRWDEDQGFNVIGVSHSLSDVIADDPEKGTLAARGGLKKGDRIVGAELAGQILPPLPFTTLRAAVDSYVRRRPGVPFRLKVERAGKEEWLLFTPEKDPNLEPLAILGFSPAEHAGNLVRAIHPASEATKDLRVQDRIVAIDGTPSRVMEFVQVLEQHPGKDGMLSLTVQSADRSERTVRVDRTAFLNWLLRDEIYWDDGSPRIAEMATDAPLRASGLAADDVVHAVNGTIVYSRDEITEALNKEPSRSTAEVEVLRGETVTKLGVPRAQLVEANGVVWDTMPLVGAVYRGGPADSSGLTVGSKIQRVSGKRIFGWLDLKSALEKAQLGDSVEIEWLSPTDEPRRATVKLNCELGEELDPRLFESLQRTIRVGALESVGVGARRTVLAAKQIFLTIRSLLRRDVSPKNLSGPLGITHLLTKVAQMDSWSTLIYYLALISINLGLFNLLPFPILDGGHLLFLAIEKVKGSPVSAKVQEWAMNVAFLAIICLALFVTFNDLKRLLG
jgi:regulator of sigma E protease